MTEGALAPPSRHADPLGAARTKVVLGAMLFSTGGAAVKACGFSGVQVAGLRSLVAATLFLVALPASRRLASVRIWLVGLAFAATMMSFVVANKLTTAANAIFLQATSPLFILVLSPLLLREKILRRDLAFLAACIVGMTCFFVGAEPPRETAPDPMAGNVLALGSSVAYAFTILGFRWLARDDGPRAASPAAGVVAGHLLVFAAALPWICKIDAVRTQDGLAIAYLGLFQVGLAYILVTSALRRVTALETSLLLMVEPVLSPVWAYLLHGERPGPWAIGGGALILLATLVHSVAARRG